MAYQAGASLGQFWDAMLQLRSQRLREAELKQAQQNRMMEMGQQVSSQIGSSILGAMKQRNSDALYNSMMEQGMGGNAPRAGAVNVPWSDKEMAGKAFTGGKEEYGARMEMAQMGQKMLQQQNANYQAKQLSTLRQQQIAKNKFDASSKPFTSAFKDMDAYLDNQRVHTEGIQTAIEAGNRPVYEQGVQAQTSLYKAYKEAHPNSDVPPPITPPFVKESEMKAISEAQQGISAERQALGGMKETEPWISPSIYSVICSQRRHPEVVREQPRDNSAQEGRGRRSRRDDASSPRREGISLGHSASSGLRGRGCSHREPRRPDRQRLSTRAEASQPPDPGMDHLGRERLETSPVKMARLVPQPPHGFEEVLMPEPRAKDAYARQEIDQIRQDVKTIEDKLRECCVPTEEVREWEFIVKRTDTGMTIKAKAK